MTRTLAEVTVDQERVFRDLLAAQQQLEALSRAGGELGLVDGETSEVDEVLARVHGAQHRLEALAAEAIQAAMATHPD